MSYPQVQATNYYLNAMEDDGDEILTSENKLNMRHEVPSCRFCADI